MLTSAVGVLFDGFAYGMLLFLLSVGLSVTLGMMNFVNLAHCSFAMVGGYTTVTLDNRFGWPFLATLPLAFLARRSSLVWKEPVQAACTGHRPRPVPAHDRHRLHLDRGVRLVLHHRPAVGPPAGVARASSRRWRHPSATAFS
jgi:hypothetical protein